MNLATFSGTVFIFYGYNQWYKFSKLNELYPNELFEINISRLKMKALMDIYKRNITIFDIIEEKYESSQGLEGLAVDPNDKKKILQTWSEISGQLLYDFI